MIVMGSRAAEFWGVPLGRKPNDIDLLGTRQELEEFRSANRDYIADERTLYGQRVHFRMKPGLEFEKIEFGFGERPSDAILAELCSSNQIEILKSVAYVPSINLLYLTKRAQLNQPVNFSKHLSDVLRLKRSVSQVSERELEYYKVWKEECRERLAKFPHRFTIKVPGNEFVRKYNKDDVRRAVAFSKGNPVIDRCRRFRHLDQIERDVFESLPMAERLKLVQEEIFVIGIERYDDNKLRGRDVYKRALIKITRDLFIGWLQDFCFDNIDGLMMIPAHDFMRRFKAAQRNGEIRMLTAEQARSETDRENLVTGRNFFLAGRLLEAAALFRAVQQSASPSSSSVALYYLGRIAARSGETAKAEQLVRQSLSIEGRNADAWHTLANILRLQGRMEEAVSAYNLALAFRPKFFAACANLGTTFEAMGERDKAAQAYKSALEVVPQHPGMQSRLAAILAPERRH